MLVFIALSYFSRSYVPTSDNKYVQYRLMDTSFSLSVSHWQGVDVTPTANSKNLVESGGVNSAIKNNPQIGYYVCSTEGDVADKVVTAPGFELTTFVCIKVKMQYKDESHGAWLNINNTGRKGLFFNGSWVNFANTWSDGGVIEVYYDGEHYQAHRVIGLKDEQGILDVSLLNSSAGVPKKYTSIDSAINTVEIPSVRRHPGMSVRFILRTGAGTEQDPYIDRYVQYRFMLSEYTPAQFNDISNWQGIDLIPTESSHNLVESGGVKAELNTKMGFSDGDALAENIKNDTGRYGDAIEMSSEANLYDNTSTHKLSSHGSQNSKVYYKQFSTETSVNVSATYKGTTQKMYVGIASLSPSVDVDVSNVQEKQATFSHNVIVPAGKYLYVCCNVLYWENIVVKEPLTIKESFKQDADAIAEIQEEIENVSAKSNVTQYDGQVVNVLYSTTPVAIPPNTEAHFRNGITAGFKAMKADMRLTSDNKIVLCHDAGYTLDGNGRITTYNAESATAIHSITLTQVLALEFATQVEGQYVSPCTLETFLYLCKRYDIIPFLTLRDEQWASTTVTEMYRLLVKYALVTKVIINLYPANQTLCNLIKAADSSIIMCDTKGGTTYPTTASIDASYNLGCQIADYRKTLRTDPSHVDPDSTLIAEMTDAFRQYAARKGIMLWACEVATEEDFAELIQNGIVGFQMQSISVVE